MILCEACYIRVFRRKHPVHINICQIPVKHHFCSKECKSFWISYVKDTGKIPPTFVEIISQEDGLTKGIVEIINHQVKK